MLEFPLHGLAVFVFNKVFTNLCNVFVKKSLILTENYLRRRSFWKIILQGEIDCLPHMHTHRGVEGHLSMCMPLPGLVGIAGICAFGPETSPALRGKC